MKGRICLVTGANSGIGKITALELARRGATVVLVCRDKSRGQSALDEIIAASDNRSVDLMLADLSSQAEIHRLVEDYRSRYEQLHVLVNNAGAINLRRKLSVDGLEYTFALNHLGYFLLTNLLLDAVKDSAPARIVNVASAAHWRSSIRFDDLQREREYRFMEVYGQSKLANILFTRELSRRLQGTGVTCNCVHPGLVGTNLAGNNGWLARLAMRVMRPFILGPKEGAQTVIYLATSPELDGITGKYFVEMKEAPSSVESNDPAVARRLWQVSEELTGLS